jgi:hypothetical protein
MVVARFLVSSWWRIERQRFVLLIILLLKTRCSYLRLQIVSLLTRSIFLISFCLVPNRWGIVVLMEFRFIVPMDIYCMMFYWQSLKLFWHCCKTFGRSGRIVFWVSKSMGRKDSCHSFKKLSKSLIWLKSQLGAMKNQRKWSRTTFKSTHATFLETIKTSEDSKLNYASLEDSTPKMKLKAWSCKM